MSVINVRDREEDNEAMHSLNASIESCTQEG